MSRIRKNERIVVTWSGGLDTTALIAYLVTKYEARIFPIFINCGQENYSREKRSVRSFTSKFKKNLRSHFEEPFEATVPIPAPEFKRRFPKGPQKFYSVRNSDMVNSAVRYALLLNIRKVAVGALFDDRLFFDISPRYWIAKTNEIEVGTGKKVTILTPFQSRKWNKSDVVLWCYENDVDIHESWTCWKDGPIHCGKCDACVSRKLAFHNATRRDSNVRDLTAYVA